MSIFCCSSCWNLHRSRSSETAHPTEFGQRLKSTDLLSTTSEAEVKSTYLTSEVPPEVASAQQLLRVHHVDDDHKLHNNESIPALNGNDEVLIQVCAIGLNPIDWKAPKYGWGLPSLPCVLGRDMLGVIARSSPHSTTAPSHRALKIGDVVGAVSTDYRDYRKAAFQQYAVASIHNIYRIPSSFENDHQKLASIGVAFVTAALTLGVSFGVKLFQPSHSDRPLDLLEIVRSTPQDKLAEDVYDECFSIGEEERLRRNQWLVIWGAGTTVGLFLAQLAKLAGIKVLCVADATKSGSQLVDIGVDLLVHRHDTAEAVKIIRSVTQSRGLYYAVDVVGKESAGMLQSLLHVDATRKSHLASIVSSPKESVDSVVNHKVPVKLFHEVPRLGAALMQLLEDLLESG